MAGVFKLNIQVKYGRSIMTADLDDRNVLEVIEGNPRSNRKTEEQVLDEALAHPVDSARLSELVHPGEKICIIIPDITRSWQKTDIYLYKIVDELNAGGVEDRDILFLSATGTHREQTEAEHQHMLGEKLASRFQVWDHDCMDRDNHVYLGTTSFGTPVSIDRRALACDHIILTGAIIYHFLAGWSGGKKTILPGIASYESIMHNHGLSLRPEFGAGITPGVCSANIQNNPVHQDMMEAASFVKPLFLFNVIMGPDGEIAGAVAGNYITAHARGRELVNRLDSVRIKGRSDVVIATAGGFPKDINLYQGIKVLINAREAVRDRGTIILLLECGEGIGGDDGLLEIITKFDDLADRERYLRDAYSITKFVGYYFCSVARQYQLILVSSLDPELMKRAGITVVKTLEEALAMARKTCGTHCSVNVMPHGASTFPIVEETAGV